MAEEKVQTYHMSSKKLEDALKIAIENKENFKVMSYQEAIEKREAEFYAIKNSFPGGIRL